jgi:hypothetical protein
MASAAKLEARGLSGFQQAHGDLLEAARLQAEAALRQRQVAKDAALAAASLSEQAETNLERADRLAGFLSL